MKYTNRSTKRRLFVLQKRTSAVLTLGFLATGLFAFWLTRSPYYLGDSLTKGEHIIQVILSTNNHRELQKNAQLIKATAIIKVD